MGWIGHMGFQTAVTVPWVDLTNVTLSVALLLAVNI